MLAINENPITSMFLFCAGILVILPLVDSCLRKKKKDLEKNGKKTEKNCPSINFTDLASAAGGGALFRYYFKSLVLRIFQIECSEIGQYLSGSSEVGF